MPEALCIIGTDTDAGKTFITSALAKAALNIGKTVLILKPVQTGCINGPDGKPLAPDIEACLRAAPGAEARAIELFTPACSPHLAARASGRALTAFALAEAVRAEIAVRKTDIVLVEGAGGLHTPLSESETLIDLLVLLSFPVLLVVGNKLGAVNHALLSIEACKLRRLRLTGFVTSEAAPALDGEEEALRRDNVSIIARLGGLSCLACLPHLAGANGKGEERDRAWERAAAALRPVLDGFGSSDSPDFPGTVDAFHAPDVPCLPEPPDISAIPNTPDALNIFNTYDIPGGHDAPGAGGGRGAKALLAYDRDHVWHPYTSALRPTRVWEAEQTRGARIILRGGRELVDGMASWWCAIHGYNHPVLMRALHSQAARMPHVMFGGLTHRPAVSLAEKLLKMAPQGLERVFFADSGSVSVEVALKMALQYQTATGRPEKKRILALRGGYHGDTFGAMSVCDPEKGMHHLFSGALPSHIFAPRPECRFDAPYDPASFEAFEAVLAANAKEIAAVILEPVVQGAGGMWLYHPLFLRDVKKSCERHGCLLILDEIATGFGRTGKMFACDHAGVAPDILCLGKGLSGGVMSLAATLATGAVARGISQEGGALMHGPTFMGNPLACAVAGASLSLLAEGKWKNDVARIEAGLQQGLSSCAGLDGVTDARVLGAVGVLEMERPVNAEKLQRYFVNRGVWIRPFSRLIYVMPPYVTTDRDIETLTRAMRDAVEEGVWR